MFKEHDYREIQKLSQFFKDKKVMVRGIEIVASEEEATTLHFELYTGFSKSLENIISQLVIREEVTAVSRLN